MARILRGEIRWADLDPTRGNEQSGRRPVLILSADVFNERSGTVIAVALTSQAPRAGFPLTLELDSAKLPKISWVKISQIRTLSTERIGRQDRGGVAGGAGAGPGRSQRNPGGLTGRCSRRASAATRGHESGYFDWAEPDEAVHTFVNDLERSAGTYLDGRRIKRDR